MKSHNIFLKLLRPAHSILVLMITVQLVSQYSLAAAADPQAQNINILFSDISIEDGLSQSIVGCIVQDSRGIMWFGTEDGLNMYDGYGINVMKNIPGDPNSLSYNEILSLLSDRQGDLWIGTFHGGLNLYNPLKKEFTRYQHDPNDIYSLSHDIVRTVFEDSAGEIWVGTDDGLNLMNRKLNGFKIYKHDPAISNGLSHSSVTAICEDKSGILWVGTNGGGLNQYDRTQDVFIHKRLGPGNTNLNDRESINSLFEDHDGNLWIGTNGNGLYALDPGRNLYTHYLHDGEDEYSISNNEITSIFADHLDRLWIGTNGGGLNLFDKKSNQFNHFINDPNDDTSISFNEIMTLYEDRSGVIWIGTYGGGVSKFDSKRKKFNLYKRELNNPNSLSHDIVWNFHEDTNGILWIGTHGGGLDRLDRSTNTFQNFRNDPGDPSSLNNDFVRVVTRDSRGSLWIGTNGGGLSRMNEIDGTFINYMNDPADSNTISYDEIRSIYEDSEGLLWIGTNGGGLNRFNPLTGDFRRYQESPSIAGAISNNFIRAMLEDSRGNFWIGTQGGGLNLMDRESETFTVFHADPDDPGSISNSFVFSILESRTGILWIGTWGGGLNRLDAATGQFTHYTTADGLASNAIYGALEDDRGNLWISSNDGISRFNPNRETFKNFNVDDGLQSNEFNGGAFHKSKRTGELFFGGIYGFNYFYPNKIINNPYVPPVIITSFLKFNKEVDLNTPISETKSLVLNYKDLIFSFEFAALDYTSPRRNQYAYKMVGLHEDWIQTDSDHRSATFTTLKPGRYTFMVKGSNNDGLWNDNGTFIDIVVTPPFWKAPWFITLAVLSAILIMYFSYLWSLRNVRMKTELQAAQDAQMSILPQIDPIVKGFDISGICIPANEVGGDFYDIFWQDDDATKLGLAIGDVSGKAMKAAMFAVMSSGILTSMAGASRMPAEVLTDMNGPLFEKTNDIMFTALCFATLDVTSGNISYALAGISEPILRTKSYTGGIKTAQYGLPLGAFNNTVYAQDTVKLEKNDVMIFFTDGITEAHGKAEEFYEDTKLISFLKSIPTDDLMAREIRDNILADVRIFMDDSLQQDDMTLVVVKAV